MLRIRKTQMTALASVLAEGFADRAAAFLAATFPAKAAGLEPTELSALVGAGIARAAAAGIETEQDVVRFLALELIAGPDLADAPWAAPLLAEPMPAEAKLSRLYAQARRHGFTVRAALQP